MNVVPLNNGLPSLNDLPGQLRNMADDIESGAVVANAIMLIIPQDDVLPAIYLWGENDGPYADIGLLELAKTAIVRRFSTD